MDTGPEPIHDPDERRQLRQQALVVYAKSVALAAVLTALTLLA